MSARELPDWVVDQKLASLPAAIAADLIDKLLFFVPLAELPPPRTAQTWRQVLARRSDASQASIQAALRALSGYLAPYEDAAPMSLASIDTVDDARASHRPAP